MQKLMEELEKYNQDIFLMPSKSSGKQIESKLLIMDFDDIKNENDEKDGENDKKDYQKNKNDKEKDDEKDKDSYIIKMLEKNGIEYKELTNRVIKTIIVNDTKEIRDILDFNGITYIEYNPYKRMKGKEE